MTHIHCPIAVMEPAHPLRAIVPSGFPVKHDTDGLDRESLYTNSLEYLKVGSTQRLRSTQTFKVIGFYCVTSVDIGARTVTTRPHNVFRYCSDGVWRPLRRGGDGVMIPDTNSFLDVSQVIHPRAWVSFVPHKAPSSSMKAVTAEPLRLTESGDTYVDTPAAAKTLTDADTRTQDNLAIHGSIHQLNEAAIAAARLVLNDD